MRRGEELYGIISSNTTISIYTKKEEQKTKRLINILDE